MYVWKYVSLHKESTQKALIHTKSLKSGSEEVIALHLSQWNSIHIYNTLLQVILITSVSVAGNNWCTCLYKLYVYITLQVKSVAKWVSAALEKHSPRIWPAKSNYYTEKYQFFAFILEKFTPDRKKLHGHRPWCPWQIWGMWFTYLMFVTGTTGSARVNFFCPV